VVLSNTTYYNLEWDYWQLYHKVTFDGPNRLILVNEGETNLNVTEDIYSAWKEWIQFDSVAHFNSGFVQAMTTTGGDPLPGEEALDATFFLINGWKIKPYPGSYNLTITGNIFDVNGENIITPADRRLGVENNITISLELSAIVRRLGTLTTGADETKIDEIWKIHGLDADNPMVVNNTGRRVSTTIIQTFSEDDPDPGSITTRRT
jgi:hypothetical protein